MRMVVDFPAPFGPRKPNISPRQTSRSSASTATNFLKRLVSLLVTSTLSVATVPPCPPRAKATAENSYAISHVSDDAANTGGTLPTCEHTPAVLRLVVLIPKAVTHRATTKRGAS